MNLSPLSLNTPWSAIERATWLASRVKQRSYADEVLNRIELLSYRFDVQEYGKLEYSDEHFSLLALQSRDWNDELPTVLVTGGVHGYETSGVQGALDFLDERAQFLERDFLGYTKVCCGQCQFNLVQFSRHTSFLDFKIV